MKTMKASPRTLVTGAVAIAFALLLGLGADAQVGITINGNGVDVSPSPIIQAGRVFVPLRGVFENLGASVVYSRGQINATGNGRDISLQIAFVLGNPPPGQNTDRTFATIDWRFFRNWSLATTFGDAGSSMADVIWQYRY